MTKTKKVLSGMVFAAIVALSLVASGGDAYAKMKSSGGNIVTNDVGSTTTVTTTDILQPLGVTWEE